MAPSTPPPPSNDELAALTIASATTVVISPRIALILAFAATFSMMRGLLFAQNVEEAVLIYRFVSVLNDIGVHSIGNRIAVRGFPIPAVL